MNVSFFSNEQLSSRQKKTPFFLRLNAKLKCNVCLRVCSVNDYFPFKICNEQEELHENSRCTRYRKEKAACRREKCYDWFKTWPKWVMRVRRNKYARHTIHRWNTRNIKKWKKKNTEKAQRKIAGEVAKSRIFHEGWRKRYVYVLGRVTVWGRAASLFIIYLYIERIFLRREKLIPRKKVFHELAKSCKLSWYIVPSILGRWVVRANTIGWGTNMQESSPKYRNDTKHEGNIYLLPRANIVRVF